MNANDVIECYVTDVAMQLPRKQRNDVAFELRALLNEELEGKAEAAGRPAEGAPRREVIVWPAGARSGGTARDATAAQEGAGQHRELDEGDEGHEAAREHAQQEQSSGPANHVLSVSRSGAKPLTGGPGRLTGTPRLPRRSSGSARRRRSRPG